MAVITRLNAAQSQVGDSAELAHIDVLIGPRGSAAEHAFVSCLTNQKAGFAAALVTLESNLMAKPACALYNKVSLTHRGAAGLFFGPVQRGVARALVECVEQGVIPRDEADAVWVCVGAFLHWQARDVARIEENHRRATFEALARAVGGLPSTQEVLAKSSG